MQKTLVIVEFPWGKEGGEGINGVGNGFKHKSSYCQSTVAAGSQVGMSWTVVRGQKAQH